MRKQASLLSLVTLVVVGAMSIKTLVQPHIIGPVFFLIPVAAFALAIAVYSGHLSGPWSSSIAWLLNGIMAMASGFTVIFDGWPMLSSQPLHLSVTALVLVSSLLNTIILYPRSPKPQIGS